MKNNSSNQKSDILALAKKLSLSEFNSTNLRVDSSQNRIYLDNTEQLLQPKVMQLLLLLCAANGKTLSKEQLNSMLWPDTQVGPDSLANTMTRLRKALNDSSKQPQFIETVQRKGYRWLQSVEQIKSPVRHNNLKYPAIVSVLLIITGSAYWLNKPEPEKFPFTDLSIQTTDEGLEVKVGIKEELNQENQEKIKQEISRITGKSPDQMKILVDPDCTPEEIESNDTENCSLVEQAEKK